MCAGAYRGRGVSRLMCKYLVKLSRFMFLFYGALFYVYRNSNLPLFKKGVFVRNGCFSPMRSISVVMK